MYGYQYVEGQNGVVCAGHPIAVSEALEVMKKGGNAADAIIQAAAITTVVRPEMSSLAGFGGALIYYDSIKRKTSVVDFATRAPIAAKADMFTPLRMNDPGRYNIRPVMQLHLPEYVCANDANSTGPLAVSVPPELSGWDLSLKTFGTITLKEVLFNAADVAEKGFPLHQFTVKGIEEEAPFLCKESRKILMPNDTIPRVGSCLKLFKLATTLRHIASKGLPSFYGGDVGKTIVGHIQSKGGILNYDDLCKYKAVITEPLSAFYRGLKLVTPPQSCGGGATVFQTLRILEGFPLPHLTCQKRLEIILAANKLAWIDRLKSFGDPDYMCNSVEYYLDEKRINQQRNIIRERTFINIQSDNYYLNNTCTSNLLAIDKHGNVAAMTQSIGLSFGSLEYISELGLFLNDGMCSFVPKPGEVNSISSWKRPICRMAPIIVLSEDDPIFAMGGAGGRRIITGLVQVLLHLIDAKQNIFDSVAQPRFHIEDTNYLWVENNKRGLWDTLPEYYNVQEVPNVGGWISVAQIDREDSIFRAAVDPRDLNDCTGSL